MAEFFGFEIKRASTKTTSQTFTAPSADDGVQTIMGGGHYGTYLDIEGKVNNEADLIRRYREVAMQPECDQAIEDVINEGIVIDDNRETIRLNMHTVPFSTGIKKKIQEEFNNVLSLLEFEQKGHDIFRRWYVDGRIVYHKIIDPKNIKGGITELRYIDPRKIKKVRKPKKTEGEQSFKPKDQNAPPVVDFEEFYIYNEKGVQPGASSTQGLAISKDSIAFCPSGMIDQQRNMILSHLHKAIKPVNQLRMIEDSIVIYRISRAPERRIFYIDVGNLPKAKAEQYLKDVMNRYRNKLVYDASTGEIRDDRQYMSMLEDFWLPRREGGRGTEITTLPGGQNLSEIEDIQYFQKKLYKSLNVPISRLESDTGFSLGRASEITRDEVKFSKFIDRIRKKFGRVFNDILETQLVLKGIMKKEEFEEIKQFINYNFNDDNHFTEMKETEVLRERLNTLREIDEYVGKYYSREFIRKRVLLQSDDDIKDIDKQIDQEKAEEPEEEGDDDNFGI